VKHSQDYAIVTTLLLDVLSSSKSLIKSLAFRTKSLLDHSDKADRNQGREKIKILSSLGHRETMSIYPCILYHSKLK